MEKALFWIENMYFSWFEVENTLKWMCLLQTCSHCAEKYYAAHTQKKWVGKPFDWSLVKKKKNIAMLGQPAVELMSLSS